MIRQVVKKFIPDFVLAARRRFARMLMRAKFKDSTPKEVFEAIYRRQMWGGPDDRDEVFRSGSGTHKPLIASTYIGAVEKFLGSMDSKPDVVDLGCGDFAVGSELRKHCNRYIACDVVEPLIARNKEKYKDLDVDFRLVDITSDELPEGDVVFLRQVLQHLSNRQIRAVVPKLQATYRYLVLTEHLPLAKGFVPNLDKPMGPDTRLDLGENGSGVVLTEPPFCLAAKESVVLCEAEYHGVVRTTLYTLR